MKYLYWDIDGTLMLTGGAGYDAMVSVIKEYYFLKDFQFANSLAGRTDSEIIKEAVIQVRGKFRPADAAGLLIRYHMELRRQLPLHEGKVLRNVEKTLQYFSDPQNGYVNCLLTGNTSSGAQLKLTHYGLNQYFDFPRSVFGELSENREELAKIAFQRFYVRNPEITPASFIFIGDTPNDVKCANAIGAKSIVILEGSSYNRSDFAEVNPWKIISRLPDDPAEFARLLNEA